MEDGVAATRSHHCAMCNIDYATDELFYTHIIGHPRCSGCNRFFKDAESLAQHYNETTCKESLTVISIAVTQKPASTINDTKSNIVEEIDAKRSAFSDNQINMPSSEGSKKATVHSISPCLKCNVSFSTTEMLKSHQRKWHSSTPYSSNQETETGRAANNEPRLDASKEAAEHSASPCLKCNVNFSTIELLKAHKKKWHSTNQNSFNNGQDTDSERSRSNDGHLNKPLLGTSKEIPVHSTSPCLKCNVTFSTSELLRTHQRKWHTECLACSKHFQDIYLLNKHQRATKPGFQFRCCICRVLCKTQTEFDQHIDGHSLNKCHVCHQSFNDATSLQKHYKNEHIEITESWLCTFCNITFAASDLLDSHHTKWHTECLVCDTNFQDTFSLKKHKRSNKAGLVIKCCRCKVFCKSQSEFDQHVNGHEINKCHVCDQSLDDNALLQQHYKSEHHEITEDQHVQSTDSSVSKSPKTIKQKTEDGKQQSIGQKDDVKQKPIGLKGDVIQQPIGQRVVNQMSIGQDKEEDQKHHGQNEGNLSQNEEVMLKDDNEKQLDQNIVNNKPVGQEKAGIACNICQHQCKDAGDYIQHLSQHINSGSKNSGKKPVRSAPKPTINKEANLVENVGNMENVGTSREDGNSESKQTTVSDSLFNDSRVEAPRSAESCTLPDILEIDPSEDSEIIYKCGLCSQSYSKESELSKHFKLQHQIQFEIAENIPDDTTEENDEVVDLLSDTDNTDQENNSVERLPDEEGITDRDGNVELEQSTISNLVSKEEPFVLTESCSLPEILEMNKMEDSKIIFKCGLCPVTCAAQSDLSEHFKLAHEIEFQVTEQTTGENKSLVSLLDKRNTTEDEENMHSEQNILPNSVSKESGIEATEMTESCTLPELLEMNQTEDSEIIFKCGLCPKTFSIESDLSEHFKLEHEIEFQLAEQTENRNQSLSGPEFTCGICEAVFVRQESFDLHMKGHSPNTYRCNLCQTLFLTHQSLMFHKESHSQGENQSNQNGRPQTLTLKCSESGEKISSQTELLNHWKTHPKCKPYCCTYCDHPFKYPGFLNRHEEKHMIKCHVCNKPCRDKDELDSHSRSHLDGTEQKDKPFLCNTCPSR